MSEFTPGIKDLLTAGDMVQIKPHVESFGGCAMVVTEANRNSPYVKGYGINMGRPDVPIYTRIRWADVVYVGRASFVTTTNLTGKLKELADEAERREEAPRAKARKRASAK